MSLAKGDPVRTRQKLRLRLQRLSSRLIAILYQSMRAAQAIIWLGLLDDGDLLRATDLYYSSTTIYATQDYNLLGLQAWERVAVERWFPRQGRILVTSMGGGREVYGLAKLGFQVEASEPNEQLAAHASRWLENQGVKASILPGEYLAPQREGAYDGVLLGWASYTHMVGREQRIAFLKNVRAAMKTGAPVLLSFFTREETAWQYRWVAWLANQIRKLSLRKATIEVGDWMELYFYHFFTSVEMEAELRAAELRMVHFSIMDCSHAVGIADP